MTRGETLSAKNPRRAEDQGDGEERTEKIMHNKRIKMGMRYEKDDKQSVHV